MNRLLGILIAGFGVLGLFGCDSGSGRASGPGSETTNGIVAKVLLEDGTPATNAAVALRRMDFISKDTSGRVSVPDFYLDSSGTLSLDSLEKGDYRLTVSLGKIYSREVTVSDSVLDLGSVHLEEPGDVVGVLAGENVAWVGVYGLDVLARVDSSGNFSVQGLPPGELKLFALSRSMDSVVVDTGMTVVSAREVSWIHQRNGQVLDTAEADTSVADTVVRDTASVDTTVRDSAVWMLFEDFEDSAAFAAKAWYFSADTLADISYPTDYAWNGVVQNGDRSGNVFAGYYTASDGGYVIFGTKISDSLGVDFSDLDSIVFYARGSGSLRLSLERWEASASDNLKAWTDDLSLSSTWTRYSVTPEDFLTAEEDSLSTGWESVRGHVSRFHFFGVGGTEMALDDIAVYGLEF